MTLTRFFHRYRRLWFAVSALIITVFFFAPPVTLLDKTNAIGYAVCHQIPSRTFFVDGTPLPVCARCTGIYLGALVGIGSIFLRGRQRSVEFAAKPILVILVGFIGVMGIDGINSYLSFFPRAPQLYEPQNWLRLITGTLHGLAISTLIWPVFSQAFWHVSTVTYQPVVSNFKELAVMLIAAGLTALVVLWQHPLLLYPLTLLSTAGVLLMFSLIFTTLVLVLIRQEGQGYTWSELILPFSMGLAMTLLLLSGMGGLRALLTHNLAIPLPG